MIFNTILTAILPSAWFYAGYAWANALRFRPKVIIVPVEIERLPAQYQVIGAQLRRAAARARLVGPGYLVHENGMFTVCGLRMAYSIACDTDQIAPAPEKEARR